MVWLLVTFIITLILTAFFYSVKVVFASAWKEELSDLPPKAELAVKRVAELREAGDDVDFTVETGKALSTAILLLSVIAFLTEIGYFIFEMSVESVVKVVLIMCCMAILAKVAPKSVARVFAGRLIVVYVRLYFFFETLFWPLTALEKFIKRTVYSIFHFEERLGFLSHEQREQIRETEEKEDALDTDEKDMIHSILEFGDTVVGEIMVPRTDVISVNEDVSVSELVAFVNEHGHSRIPVYRNSIDEIVGILNVKDLYKAIQPECSSFSESFNLKEYIRPAFFVPENKKINELFKELKTEKVHLAVVVDEYGGVCGIVTMEDILEEIVGEIHDEFDNEEARFKKVNDNTFDLDPKLDIEEINAILGTSLDTDSEDYKTLSGLIMTHSGSIPEENQSFEIENLKIKIIKMDGHRIMRVRVERESQLSE
ncbi:MAG: HlyC/CorC family transporter [Fibrobacteres bacterium]|nr:HlyC/CorC family transporter [Fibrobacterota bacterium]